MSAAPWEFRFGGWIDKLSNVQPLVPCHQDAQGCVLATRPLFAGGTLRLKSVTLPQLAGSTEAAKSSGLDVNTGIRILSVRSFLLFPGDV